MTAADVFALSPFIVMTVATLVVMLAVAFRSRYEIVAGLALLGLALAFLSLFVVWPTVPRQVTALVMVDSFALFYMGLLFAASAVVVALSYIYMARREGNRGELFVLLMLATVGGAALAASSHFASFFLGLEVLSVSLYALIAYPRTQADSIEAGVKYLILAGVSSAFLLFGMALVYGDLGTMEFAGIAALAAAGVPGSGLILAGLALVVVGLGFKLAVVPFHMWTPDVYQGAPAPVTAFVASVSKGAVFALLLRFFTHVDLQLYGSLFVAFVVIAIASMFVGNLLALLQDNVKRILAYSSIAHLGYLLVAFLAGGALALTAATFYLVAYFITILGAFGVVGILSWREGEADTIDDYRGLFWRRPWLAVVFTAMLLSLAGIPLTAGFIGKFYVAVAGVGAALWLLVIVLAVTSTIGLYYYLRIAAALYARAPGPEGAATVAPVLSSAGGVVLAVLTLLLIWLGVYPAPLIALIQAAVGGLS